MAESPTLPIESAASSLESVELLPGEIWLLVMERLLADGCQKSLLNFISTNKEFFFMGISVLYSQVVFPASKSTLTVENAYKDFLRSGKWSYTRQLGLFLSKGKSLKFHVAVLEGCLDWLKTLSIDTEETRCRELLQRVSTAPRLEYLHLRVFHRDVGEDTLPSRLPPTLRTFVADFHDSAFVYYGRKHLARKFFQMLNNHSNEDLHVYLRGVHIQPGVKLFEQYPSLATKLRAASV